MKKIITTMLILVMAISIYACAEEATEHAEYSVYNTTGQTVTELYMYDAGSEDKGENLAGEQGFADGESIVIVRDADKETADTAVYILEFVVEGQEAKTFETLHFETVPICLLAADAITGATPIAFAEPKE